MGAKAGANFLEAKRRSRPQIQAMGGERCGQWGLRGQRPPEQGEQCGLSRGQTAWGVSVASMQGLEDKMAWWEGGLPEGRGEERGCGWGQVM